MPEELQKALPDLDKMKDLFCKSLQMHIKE